MYVMMVMLNVHNMSCPDIKGDTLETGKITFKLFCKQNRLFVFGIILFCIIAMYHNCMFMYMYYKCACYHKCPCSCIIVSLRGYHEVH